MSADYYGSGLWRNVNNKKAGAGERQTYKLPLNSTVNTFRWLIRLVLQEPAGGSACSMHVGPPDWAEQQQAEHATALAAGDPAALVPPHHQRHGGARPVRALSVASPRKSRVIPLLMGPCMHSCMRGAGRGGRGRPAAVAAAAAAATAAGHVCRDWLIRSFCPRPWPRRFSKRCIG